MPHCVETMAAAKPAATAASTRPLVGSMAYRVGRALIMCSLRHIGRRLGTQRMFVEFSARTFETFAPSFRRRPWHVGAGAGVFLKARANGTRSPQQERE